MREVGSLEAERHLGDLLDLVQQGEEIVIIRHGKRVARLVAETAPPDRSGAKAAVGRLRARTRERIRTPIGIDEWRGLRDEGRP